MKKEILPLKLVIQGGAMWENKSKQDKARCVIRPRAISHRRAKPGEIKVYMVN